MKPTQPYRSLDKWSIDELIHLEEELRGSWPDIQIPYDSMRHGDDDGFGAAPNYVAWLEHHLTRIDRLLTDAGYPIIRTNRRPGIVGGRTWRRSLTRIEGEAS